MFARLRSLLPSSSPARGPSDNSSSISTAPYTALPATSTTSLVADSPPYALVDAPTLPFLVLGAATLLPWNLILSSLPFFASLLPPSSALHTSLPSVLSFLATGTNFVSLAGITFFGGKSAGVAGLVKSTKSSLLFLLCAFSAAQSFIVTSPAEGQAGWFTVVFLAAWVVLMMLLTSYLQSSVIAYSSLFGLKPIAAVQTGQGAIAVALSIVQVLSSVIATHSDKTNGQEGTGGFKWPTAGFFFAGGLLQVYVLHALDQISKHPAHTVALASSQASTDDDVTTSRVAKGHASDMLSLFRRNALINLSIALVFTVTLSVFPAVTAQVVPVGRSGWWRRTEIWVPLGFLAFNVGDLVGRTLPGLLLVHSPFALLIISVSRLAFIPFFLSCNLASLPSSSSPTFTDLPFFFGVLALGASNGFLATNTMILASTSELNPVVKVEERDLAGKIAVFCLVGGLVLGSASSFGVVGLVGSV